ncbi:MAG TPA: maleylpyruvate isomerase N-terminal domain-containing protein [Chloroflexota bacterium]|nr:maleylpyruvate isomerase N-terminal domain-containing protein [Chloroflexota bacterium]
MSANEAQVKKLLQRLDAAWTAFQESYAGIPGAQLMEPGAVGEWSVKDVLAHVTIWEEEALKHLPVIIAGGRPPRYVTYGGIDAFNARMIEQRRGLSLSDVRRQLDDTHRRLIAFIQNAPADQFARETRARRRLRLDTYGHYPGHAAAIREWRERQSVG